MTNWFHLLILLSSCGLIFQNGVRLCAAEEDEIVDNSVEAEDDEANVDSDEPVVPAVVATTDTNDEGTARTDKETGSTYTDLLLVFTKPTFPSYSQIELPAGKLVEFVIGFSNFGELEFTVDTLDASLRYPLDHNYHIQNFTTIIYDTVVPAGYQATFAYSFVPADSFAGRPFGLSINMAYKDEFGTQFYEKIYNETVVVVEVEEGLDGETFFLYIFLGAVFVLLLVLGQQFLYSVGKKRGGGAGKSAKVNVEIGTKKANDIDYDWIPKHMKDHLKKSPRGAISKSTSPKGKKGK